MEQEKLCTRVLTACRTELCQLFPALNLAFGFLPFLVKPDSSFATDGSFFYAGGETLGLYSQNPAALRRGFLHTLMHCLYLHILPPDRVNFEDWGIACDIFTERLIEAQNQPRLAVENPVRDACLEALGDRILPPEQLMRLIAGDFFPCTRQELAEAFRFDDHSLWKTTREDALRRRWEGALPGGGDLGRGGRGSVSAMEEEPVVLPEHGTLDFRRYLRKYTFPREELETDQDSFDYIYYHFGMTHYGDLPLLEPLEYREVWRLDELAIAIDTSGSCSRELVARFLRETYGILAAQENFFRRMKVVFFQCDCVLQDVKLIRSREEWERYAAEVKIRGRGGTDFRPVFREIEKLRAAGTLKRPKALLYFTDGDGIYPSQPPDYETVFVMSDGKKNPELVPKWAKQLLLEQE